MSVDKRHSSAIQRNRIDRLLVIASLYNGRGESGIAPTPAGAAGAPNTTALAESSDYRPSSQMNLVNSGSGGTAQPGMALHPAPPTKAAMY